MAKVALADGVVVTANDLVVAWHIECSWVCSSAKGGATGGRAQYKTRHLMLMMVMVLASSFLLHIQQTQ